MLADDARDHRARPKVGEMVLGESIEDSTESVSAAPLFLAPALRGLRLGVDAPLHAEDRRAGLFSGLRRVMRSARRQLTRTHGRIPMHVSAAWRGRLRADSVVEWKGLKRDKMPLIATVNRMVAGSSPARGANDCGTIQIKLEAFLRSAMSRGARPVP